MTYTGHQYIRMRHPRGTPHVKVHFSDGRQLVTDAKGEIARCPRGLHPVLKSYGWTIVFEPVTPTSHEAKELTC